MRSKLLGALGIAVLTAAATHVVDKFVDLPFQWWGPTPDLNLGSQVHFNDGKTEFLIMRAAMGTHVEFHPHWESNK
jgi:hypothetical protein